MAIHFSDKKCTGCKKGVPALTREQAEEYLKEMPEWKLDEYATKMARSYELHDFADAMKFANAVAGVAENEGHHPDLHVSWGRVTVELYTHAIQGLSENDFILASKIDRIAR